VQCSSQKSAAAVVAGICRTQLIKDGSKEGVNRE